MGDLAVLTRKSQKNFILFLKSKEAIVFILMLFTSVHVGALSYRGYQTFWWLDIVMHLVGGMWAAMFILYLKDVYAPDLQSHLPFWGYVLCGVSIVVFVGVIWEWFEFLSDLIFVPRRADLRLQLGVFDTMKDLFMDFIGGFLMTLIIASGEQDNDKI